MNLQELGSAALVLVVAAIVISVGATLNTSLASTSNCVGTWFTGSGNTSNASLVTNPMRINPLDNTWSGCCTTLNTSYPLGGDNTGYCRVWYTQSVALNTTYHGINSMNTLGTWLPIIAIVVAAVIVISLLVTYLGGLGGRM